MKTMTTTRTGSTEFVSSSTEAATRCAEAAVQRYALGLLVMAEDPRLGLRVVLQAAVFGAVYMGVAP